MPDKNYNLRRKRVYEIKLARENPFYSGEALLPAIESSFGARKDSIHWVDSDVCQVDVTDKIIDDVFNVSVANTIVDVATSGFHTIVLKSDGTCKAIGKNDFGQCDVESWQDIKKVGAGGQYSFGIKSNGDIITTLANDSSYDFLEQINHSWENVIQIETGFGYNAVFGLKSDGTVVARGKVPACEAILDWTGITQIAAGYGFVIGLKENGTCVSTGNTDDGRSDVGSWSGIKAIAANAKVTLGLLADGTCVATGRNSYGNCDVYEWADIVQMGVSHSFSIGLTKHGVCRYAGSRGSWGGCDQIAAAVESWTGIQSISVCGYRVIGLDRNGHVVFAGTDKELVDAKHWSNVRQVAVGDEHAAVVFFDGSVDYVGNTWLYYATDFTDVKSITIGYNTIYAIKNDGSYDRTGNNDYTQCHLNCWTDLKHIEYTGRAIIGLKNDGSCVAAGDNYDYHQLEIEQEQYSETWRWYNMKAITGFPEATVGVSTNPDSYGHRYQAKGRQPWESQVSGWPKLDYIAIGSGAYHTMVFMEDGQMYGIGYNVYGELTFDESWTDIIQLDGGYEYSVGLKSDGTCVACGNNEFGQCDVESWHDIVQISVNWRCTLGLKSNGTLVSCGTDWGYGALDVDRFYSKF